MRYPLIDFHGSNGNRDGDGPAAYRYTEARLAKLTEEGLLAGIKKNNVDFVPNYQETDNEPVTFPAIFPNLLCNPNTGIGVAIAANWLPHNLCEVADAIYAYMDGNEPTLPGPDFPTGGLIINKNDIPNIMRTGHGSVKVRGKYNIEDNNIIFYEIPYGVGTEDLMNEIGSACDDGRINGISNIRNESNRKGFRLVIECEKTANQNQIINLLFKETDLQTSISYNQVALLDKTPVDLNLKDCIKIYVDHNVDCVCREANYDINKINAKLHVLEGLIKALDIIDDIIAMIKASESSAKAKETLIARWEFSEIQAKAILDMKLSKLSKLEKEGLVQEQEELTAKLAKLNEILAEPVAEVRKRLQAIVQTYGDARRTELAQLATPTKEEAEIAYVEPEKCVVVLTEGGLIKRIPATSFRTQKRNGKGAKTQDDITSLVIRTNTVDNMMIFTNQGRMYRLLVDNIPVGTNVSKGTPVTALLTMEPGETAITMYSIYRDTDAKYVLFVTKNGLVKKTSLEEYVNTKKSKGVGTIKFKDEDTLAGATLVKDEDIIIITHNGYLIRFNSDEITATARMTMGVKGLSLGKDDYVIAVLPIRDSADNLAIFSSNGYGKQVALSELSIQRRGGKGVIGYKANEANGYVSCAQLVSNEDTLLLVGNKNSICISTPEIPLLTRTSIGNMMLKGNKIISASKV